MRLYIVKEGDTLSSIADKYGLELEQLLAINPQITNPDAIMPGMKIKIAVGPVAVSPDTTEIGHPFHQSQPQPQSENPYTQIPVPAMEVNQSTAPSDQSNLQTMEHATHVPKPLPSLTANVQTHLHSQQNQPYLSTIPQHFSGNPMYSGVGSLPSASNLQSAEQIANPSAHPHAANTGLLPQSSPENAMHWSVASIGYGAESGTSVNIHAPYSYPGSNVSAVNSPYAYGSMSGLGAGIGWPETYTWSTPFAHHSSAYPSYFAPAHGFQPVAGGKKPCGCGGSGIGYYSLAEKQRAENDGANVQAETSTKAATGDGRSGHSEPDAYEQREVSYSRGDREAESSSNSPSTLTSGKLKRSKNRSVKRSRARKNRAVNTARLHANQVVSTMESQPAERKLVKGTLWINV